MGSESLAYVDGYGRVLLSDVEYRTMTPKGLRQEARAIRGAAQRLLDKARALERFADQKEADEREPLDYDSASQEVRARMSGLYP